MNTETSGVIIHSRTGKADTIETAVMARKADLTTMSIVQVITTGVPKAAVTIRVAAIIALTTMMIMVTGKAAIMDLLSTGEATTIRIITTASLAGKVVTQTISPRTATATNQTEVTKAITAPDVIRMITIGTGKMITSATETTATGNMTILTSKLY